MWKQALVFTLGSLLAAVGCDSDFSENNEQESFEQQTQELSTTTEVNIDRPGYDYSNFDLQIAEPSICRNHCKADSRCKAYTYVNPGVQGANARCWLKNSIPDAVSSSCCTSGTNTHTMVEQEQNIDRPGGDYKSYDLAVDSVLSCQLDCDRDPQCRAYTYVKPGYQGPYARCWLKNTVPAAVPSDCCTSDAKFLGLSTEKNIDRTGGDYYSFDLSKADYKLCRAACDRDSRCQAYTYVPRGVQGPYPRCWLKDQRPTAVSVSGMVSGSRF